MAWYHQAVDPTVSDEVADAARERLLAYNDDDCAATYAIAEWLTANGDSARPGASLPNVATPDVLFAAMRHPAPQPCAALAAA